MKIPFSQQALIAAISLVLLGCGVDESNYTPPEEKPVTETPDTEEPETPDTEEPETPEVEEPEEPSTPKETPVVPQVEKQACAITYETWSKVHKGALVDETIEAFGCKGFLSYINETWDTSAAEKNQEVEWVWGKDLSNPTVILGYVDGKLDQKYFIVNSTEATTTCFPTKAQRAKLKSEQTLDEVETILGCKGVHQYSTEDNFTVTHYYIWKKDKDSDEYLLVMFTDNTYELIDIHYVPPKTESETKISDCTPTYVEWDKIIRRETLQAAETKLGCVGVNGNEEDETDESIKAWGKSDYSTDRVILEVDSSKYVIAKHFYAKDAKSSCVPSLKNWQDSEMNSSYVSVKQKMQCDGILGEVHTETDINFSDSQYLTKIYQWQNKLENDSSPVGRIYHEMMFLGDRLVKKLYTKSTFATCEPKQAAFAQVNMGDNLDTVNSIFGCAAELTYGNVSVSGGKTQQITQYSWGNMSATEAKTFAYVYLDNRNKVVSKFIKFSPK